ncbi:MAG: hypothetical protein ACRETW_04835 [Stenotrophobium sp.]
MDTSDGRKNNLQRAISNQKDRNSSLAFCSIATASHVTQACACLQSIRKYHENARLVLLLVSAGIPRKPLPSGIETLKIESCVSEGTLHAMHKHYTAAELCFAVKPFLIAALLEAGMEQVHYLDGDCLAFDAMTPMISALAAADLLLTPHCLSPVPEDGRTPRPLTLLKAGVFNAGYIGVRNTTTGVDFVAWLSSMTTRYAKNKPQEGMCGDQKWLDLAPALFPGMAICRHPGANVAYWNLQERHLTRNDKGRFLVNDLPLIFFHFSGYASNQSMQLSKHQNRHLPVPGSTLHELVETYRNHIAPASESFPAKQGYLRTVLSRFTPLQLTISHNPDEKMK